MDGKYTFNEFCNNLDEGYQIYYTYVRNRYLLYKTSEIVIHKSFLQNMKKILNQDIAC